MFAMLFWKEWRENLWKLLFCGAASAAFAVMLFRIRIVPDIANCVLISVVQMFVVPVVYALDIFSGEVSNRTIHLLFKIPVKRWMIFASKYLVSAVGMVLIFLVTAALMELMAHGRETRVFFLLKTNLLCGTAGLFLFTWFCPFGCQSRSEAGSLGAMFAVFIGWGIVFFWASICQVGWAEPFAPYSLLKLAEEGSVGTIFLQFLLSAGVLATACYRYVSIRRYL
jgi:ABC-type transport system involved in multi-copper enzyme maturation permease subunit